MKIYDTLSRTEKELPRNDGPLRLFVCGPTVYDYSHIGHARTYVAFDSFVKYLRHKGLEVHYLQNITDVDDRIIERAAETNQSPFHLAQQFELEYLRDMDELGVTSVDTYARATDYIPQIIEQIALLLEKEFAYEANGSVYFRVKNFKDYGVLSGQKPEEVREGAGHGNEGEGDKEDPNDFVIWKASKEGEPQWDSPWGKGRPGWHIEDTAITHTVFGSPQYELHGGARDLIFPHHEAEIALMESAYGVSPMVQTWMHTGFLNIAGEKMSKSLGNFVTIRDALVSHSPQALRLFFTTRHYRSPLDYSEEGLTEAAAAQQRIETFWRRLKTVSGQGQGNGSQEHIDAFWAHLEEDFNTPQAFASLFTLITTANTAMDTGTMGNEEAQSILTFLAEVNTIFNIAITGEEALPDTIEELAQRRHEARQAQNWDEADDLRQRIEDAGYEVTDTDEGPQVRKRR